MYRNQFIKALEDKAYKNKFRVVGVGNLVNEITTQLSILKANLPRIPCFYLGDLKMEDLSHDIPQVTLSSGEEHILWVDEYEHLPFDNLLITGKMIPENPNTYLGKILINLQIVDDVQKKHYPDIKGWCINTCLMMTEIEGEERLLYFPFTVCLTEQKEEGHRVMMYYLDTAKNLPAEVMKILEQAARICIEITLYMLKLLSCKNAVVDVVSAGGKKPSTKRPELNHHVIKIKLNKGQRFRYKNQEVDEIPFHDREKFGISGTCRGHFKTYTPEAPLFGRHVGTWWWSPRFNTKIKDYIVEK